MRFKAKATVLTVVVLCAAGCAHSDFPLSRNAPTRWRPVDDRALAEATDMIAPKILPQTYFAAAQLHERQGQVLQAIEQYRKAIAVNHDYVAAYDRLGLLLGKVGLNTEATTALRKAAELAPDNAPVHNNLGFQLVLNGDWEGAEREFDRALEIFPGFARARINRGVVMGKTQRFAEALDDFKAVLPESDAHYNLGIIYRTQEKFEQAADAFRSTLAVDSTFVAAQRQLDLLAPKLAVKQPATSTPAVTIVANDGDTKKAPIPSTTKPALTAEPLRPVGTPARTQRATVVEPPVRETTVVKPTPQTVPVSRADKPIEMMLIEPSPRTDAVSDTTVAPFQVPEQWDEPIFGNEAPVDIYDEIASLPPVEEEPCEESFVVDQPVDSTPAIDYSIVDRKVTMPPREEVIGRAVLIDDETGPTTGRRPTAAASIIQPAVHTAVVTPAASTASMDDIATIDELETELEIVRQEIDCLTDEAVEQERESDSFRHQPRSVTGRDPETRPSVRAKAPVDEVILPMRLIEEPQTSRVKLDQPANDRATLASKAIVIPARSASVGTNRNQANERIESMRLVEEESAPNFNERTNRAAHLDDEVRYHASEGLDASTDDAPFSDATVDGDVAPYPAFDKMFDLVTNGPMSIDADRAYSEAPAEDLFSTVEPTQLVDDVQPIVEPKPLPMYEVIED